MWDTFIWLFLILQQVYNGSQSYEVHDHGLQTSLSKALPVSHSIAYRYIIQVTSKKLDQSSLILCTTLINASSKEKGSKRKDCTCIPAVLTIFFISGISLSG